MKYSSNGMQFEWDEQKNATNLIKHGRSFTDCHYLWSEPFGELLAANTDIEERFVRRGMIENQVWLCVYTMRDDKYRVMSLRTKKKGKFHDEEKSDGRGI